MNVARKTRRPGRAAATRRYGRRTADTRLPGRTAATGRRGRAAALAAALAITLVAGGGAALAASSGAALAAGAGPAARPGSGAALAAGQLGPRQAVPWPRVGDGWVLAEYWPGRTPAEGRPQAAPVSLDLVDPAGGRYQLYRWPVTATPPGLLAWSGDQTRALLITSDGVEQIVLATGKISRINTPRQVNLTGYTGPDGLNLLGWQQVGSSQRLARYTFAGRLAAVLATGPDDATAVYSGPGTTLAVAGGAGLQLVSNTGGVIRTLPVPHVAVPGCAPVRWWNSTTILATCTATGAASRSQLWLVPANGSRPTALTPPRGAHSSDLGDLDAWPLPSGLYVQAAGACGTLQIFRQAASGAITLVSVPHTAGNNQILTAYGSQLLIQAPTSCEMGASLLWFNPSTRHVHMLFDAGIIGAAPYGRSAASY
jgi:hypothetical protein